MIEISIDGNTIPAEEGSTILQVARDNKIPIPHLCYHPALKPSGSCKLCGVEVGSPSGKQVVMLSCILKVKEGLVIRTDSPLVAAHREKAFAKLLTLAPESQRIRDLADRFRVPVPPEPNGCIRCRLCVRVCNEIVKARAIKMVKTESGSKVVPGEGKCIGCGTCANLCPTKVMRITDRDNVRTVSIRNEVVSRLPLERCEACGNLYATSDFLAHVAKTTSPHPDTKVVHHLCTACAKMMSDRALTENERIRK
ncbi:MAG: 2Fe-2S iron-sulfur cluster-binding protein [Desulfobacterales bacterium]|nr:2Fe-2S iron-sulfur cluster-binding protein [Desulfobacterales bacterium]